MLGSAPRAVRAVVQVLLLAIVVGAALLHAPPIGAVTAGTLQHSLAREAGGETGHGGICERQRAGVWQCTVAAPGAGGITSYQLVRRGRRCWDATAVGVGSSPDLPRAVSGCAKLRDQVRI